VQEEQDQRQPEEAQEPAAEAEPEAPAAAEEPAAEEPAAEEPAAEEPAAEEPAAEAPAEEPAEPVEQVSPREQRKRARATAPSEQRPQRSPDERARERAEQRGQKATARRRWRQKRREKDRASASGGTRAQPVEVAAAAEPGARKSFQGVVVSNKGDKSITVRIDRVGRHRVYGKVVRQSSTLHAHDERNEAGEGDVVRVVEARPLSRTKRWRLIQVLEKAK
jgi:small subunit ribosomal protein S17